ncbi:cellulose binding domain-containing protein [Spirillospora sp. NPDC048911]|uniref:protein kinase domain-containing protein n=1 Tax=Spirillospora sp. NPDC048911 TaxID=3364527 RepID=UPI00372462D6
MLTPGQSLGGRYRLVVPLGSGGMATVWRAHDTVLERAVAVKVPHENGPADWPEESTRRLQQEAKAAARLAHPNITGVYDYGEEGDLPYVVMELLDGESLAARLEDGPLSWTEAAGIGAQLADALAAAHALGVVHRDVKPANVFLTPTGVKVLDFGIAFTASARHDGPLLGTPAYVAPELRSGAEPEPSADIYSLGVTLAEAISGEPAGNATEDLGSLDVPAPMADLLASCVAEDPHERPAAATLSTALRRAAGLPVPDTPATPDRPGTPDTAGTPSEHSSQTKVLDKPVPPAPQGPTSASTPAPASALGSAPESSAPAGASAGDGGRGRRPVLIACGAVAALGLSALVIGLLQSGSEGSGATRTPPASRSAKPSPSSSVSPSGTAATTSCAVAYSVTGQWPGGFQAEVRITNTGTSAIDGWQLTWTFPGDQKITQLWNGARIQNGADVTVTAADWNRRLEPNRTAQFGFLGQADGEDRGGRPDRFALNGAGCGTG